MVVADGGGQDRRRPEGAGDLGTQDGVLLDLGEFVGHQRPAPSEQLLREANLPDVVKETRVVRHFLVLGVEADQAGDRLGRDRHLVVEGRFGPGRVLPLDQLAQAGLGGVHLAPQLAQPQQRAHPDLQVAHRDGLDDQVVGARLHYLGPFRPGVEAGHHQHRDIPGGRVGLQSPAGLVPVHSRHLHVHQDQVRLETLRRRQCFGAVGGTLGPEAQGREHAPHGIAAGAVIVHDEDRAALRHRSGGLRIHRWYDVGTAGFLRCSDCGASRDTTGRRLPGPRARAAVGG